MKISGANGALGPVESPSPGRGASSKTDDRDPKVLEASRLYEGQFLREMVRAMRKTVPESEFMTPNMAEKIYREQMDDNFVDSWVEGGGVGLGDMIYDQLMQKYPELKASDRKTLPVQPGTGAVHGKPVSFNDPKSFGYEFSTESVGGPAHAVAPVAGTVKAISKNEQGSIVVQIDHGGDSSAPLSSTIAFTGTTSSLKVGTPVQPGDRLGTVSPDSGRVLWAVKKA